MIRLIASDMDGTLLAKDGSLPQGILPLIEEMHRRDILFVAASGRQYGNLFRLFAPVKEGMAFVCENGALVMAGGKMTARLDIPRPLGLQVMDDLEAAGMRLLLSGQDTCYVEDNDRAFTDYLVYGLRNTVTVVGDIRKVSEPFLKISGFKAQGAAPYAPALGAKWGTRLSCALAGHEWLDFTRANKGLALGRLMAARGIKAEEAAAFGDNFNDVPMLEAVGHPYLMRHADPALRRPSYRLCDQVLPALEALLATQGK